jgi:hypothetical protein
MTGLRVNMRDLRKRIGKLQSIRADYFRPALMNFAKKTLQTCADQTPERSASIIRKNQRKQYLNRVNYIPSVHSLESPTLIVNEDGEHWLYMGGQWFKPAEWRVPDAVFQAYEELIQERNRRLQYSESRFIADRLQARSLYKKTWKQAGQSIGVAVSVPSRVNSSHSRHDPAKEPDKAYAQVRGGGMTLSIVVFNPLLDQATRYWPGNGRQILASAMERHRPEFNRTVKREFERLMKDVARS